MNCPNCNTTLAVSERQGVEIDYCPRCRGVWLDRGELDKLIERAAFREEPSPRRDSKDRYEDDRGRPRKRESFLGDLFDF